MQQLEHVEHAAETAKLIEPEPEPEPVELELGAERLV
jgi:hypothetical protein